MTSSRAALALLVSFGVFLAGCSGGSGSSGPGSPASGSSLLPGQEPVEPGSDALVAGFTQVCADPAPGSQDVAVSVDEVTAAVDSVPGLPYRSVTEEPCAESPSPGTVRVDFFGALDEEQTGLVASALSDGYSSGSSLYPVQGTGVRLAVPSEEGPGLVLSPEQEAALRELLGVYSVDSEAPEGVFVLEYVGERVEPGDLERAASVLADAADVDRSAVQLFPLG